MAHYFTGKPCKNGHIEKRLSSTGQCLACLRDYQKKYRDTDPEPFRARSKKWHEENREAAIERMRVYHAVNRFRLVTVKKKYNHANLARWRTIDATRRQQDLAYHIKKILRARIGSAIKRGTRTGSAVRDLGCTIAELKTYLAAMFRDGMSWDNWPTHWHIDHIRPLRSFDLTDRDQFLQACHYTNLQPLLVEEHRKKSSNERRS